MYQYSHVCFFALSFLTNLCCSPRSHLSVQPVNVSCWDYVGDWMNTQRADTVINPVLTQKERRKDFDWDHGLLT